MTFLAIVIILVVLCFLCTVYVKEKQNKISNRSISKYKIMLSPIGIDTVNQFELNNLDERARTKVFSLLTKHHLSENEVYYTNSSLGVCAFKNNCLMAIAKEQIRLAFQQSEKEVEDLHQRTKEGIETARLNGKQIGLTKGTKLTTKKSIAAKEQIRKYSKDFEGTLADNDVMKLTGLSRNTYYKYKREIKTGIQAACEL